MNFKKDFSKKLYTALATGVFLSLSLALYWSSNSAPEKKGQILSKNGEISPGRKINLSESIAEGKPFGKRDPSRVAPESIGERFDLVLTKEPLFLELKQLSEKALLTHTEKARLVTILGDDTLISKWAEEITEIKEDSVDSHAQIKRIYSLNALSMAAQWKSNPKRNLVEAVVRTAFEARLNRPEMTDELRSSLVMDKFEAWRILRTNFPTSADEIAEQEKDSPLGLLIAEAEKHSKRF